ncbi:MAG: helix-turn-helix domain-containing protein [Pseudonocardiaceae bacterium]
MNAEEARAIGRRLKRIRYTRGKSLQVVAELAGMSKSQLDRIERGEVALDRLSEIVALARVLEISPSDLMRLPVPAPGNGHIDRIVEAVRDALAAVDWDEPGGQVLPVNVLRIRVRQMRQMPRRYADVGEALPGLIRDLHTSIAAGRDVAELLALTVKVHTQITHMWLRLAGAPTDLRRNATTLAWTAAQESGDAALLGTATYGGVYALVNCGLFDLAHAALDSLMLPATTPDTVGLIGSLAITRAWVASLRQQPGDVVAPMHAAAELAQRYGEATGDDAFGFAFGPTDVGLYSMALALDSDDPDLTLSIAEGLHPERHPYSARQAAYWVDCGRALVRLPGRQHDAARAFRRAESISPHHVHRNPLVREVIVGLPR